MNTAFPGIGITDSINYIERYSEVVTSSGYVTINWNNIVYKNMDKYICYIYNKDPFIIVLYI